MEFNLANGTLTIFFKGDINSYNAEEVEKEIDGIMDNNPSQRVVLDLENLRYLSSAGLRIIIRIKQRCDDLTLVKTPKQVYEIFVMVGFQNMIKIEKL